jgi:hypothetical protein
MFRTLGVLFLGFDICRISAYILPLCYVRAYHRRACVNPIHILTLFSRERHGLSRSLLPLRVPIKILYACSHWFGKSKNRHISNLVKIRNYGSLCNLGAWTFHTTLRAFKACYRNSFTFTLCNLPIPVISFLFGPNVLLSTIFSCTHNLCSYIGDSRDSSVDRLGYGRPRFDSRHGQEIFVNSTASRPALGPTQFPIQ